MNTERKKVIFLLLRQLSRAGTERYVVNLAEALTAQGVSVHIVSARDGVMRADIGATAPLHIVPTVWWQLPALRLLILYWRYRPNLVISSYHRFHPSLLLIKHFFQCLTSAKTRLVFVLHAICTFRFQPNSPRWQRRRRQFLAMDAWVAVSHGVANHCRQFFQVPEAFPIKTIYNPLVSKKLHQDAELPCDHPWLTPQAQAQYPVVLAVARLERQKRLDRLLAAFAQVQQTSPCRLLVLGEGCLREDLSKQINALGLTDRVQLFGVVDNPFPFMKAAKLLVLSSDFEGLGNVLVESLAVGTPVVSLDCPSGPREILQDGRYGILVPMQPEPTAALAEAIVTTLQAPKPEPESLQPALEPFLFEKIAKQYLALLS